MKWIVALVVTAVVGTALVIAQRPELAGGFIRGGTGATSELRQPGTAGRRTIFASGTVEGAQRDVHLHFEIDGRLESIDVEEGAFVRKGDVLARLHADIWEQRLEEAQAKLALAESERERLQNGARAETREVAVANVAVAEVKVDQAEREWNRGKQLFGQKVISREEWENRSHNYAVAVAELKMSRAQAAEVAAPAREDELRIADAKIALARTSVDQARTMFAKTRITAPSDGFILRVDGEPGQLIHPDDPVRLITMTNPAQLRVRAFVEELDALSVSTGQRAYVTADGMPGTRFFGTVVSCAPYMTAKKLRNNMPGERIDVKVREVVIQLDDGANLVIGLPVDIFIDPTSDAFPPTSTDMPPASAEP